MSTPYCPAISNFGAWTFAPAFSDEAKIVRSQARLPVDSTPSVTVWERDTRLFENFAQVLGGDRPVEFGTFMQALKLLDYLPAAATLPATLPEISVDSDGDISFDWDEAPRRVFSLTVSRDGTIHYAGLDGHATFHGKEPLASRLPKPVAAGLARILGIPDRS